jgi:hypothetical protein
MSASMAQIVPWICGNQAPRRLYFRKKVRCKQSLFSKKRLKNSALKIAACKPFFQAISQLVTIAKKPKNLLWTTQNWAYY